MLAKSNPKNVENLEFPVSIPKKLNHSDRNKHASIMVTVRIVAISFFSPGTLNYRRHNSFTHSLTVFKSPNILKGINKIVNGAITNIDTTEEAKSNAINTVIPATTETTRLPKKFQTKGSQLKE